MTQEEERLDFTTVRENWSEYRIVKDNTIVKVKASISEMLDTGKKKGKMHEVRFGFQNQFFKESIPDDKGEPSANPKIDEEDIIEKLEVEKIREPVNIYDATGKFIVILRTELTELKRTRKFNAEGNRIYHYGIGCSVNVVEYPKAEKD